MNSKEINTMKKSLRNMIIGAVMTAGIFAASASALAATQYVTTDMNFRSGASSTSTLIGSVPAGAQVEVLDLQNGWNLIRYNGMIGYIHGGNLADTYVARPSASTTRAYYDNNFTQNANQIANSAKAVHTVYVTDGYLALRTQPTFDDSNIIGQLYTGDTVELISTYNTGSYVEVFSPKYGTYGYVNAGFLR